MTGELLVEHKFLYWFDGDDLGRVRILVVRNVESDVDALRRHFGRTNRTEEIGNADVIRILGIQIGSNADC